MDSLVQEGLQLAVTGMGTVFVFLTLLVLAMNAMSGVLRRFVAEPVQAQTPDADGYTQRRRAAIVAAIHRYRENHST